jgi:hypothetical protein
VWDLSQSSLEFQAIVAPIGLLASKFHQILKDVTICNMTYRTDNCTSIAAANGVTLTQLADWNPALGSDCSGLAPNYYICVGLPNEVTTSTTTTDSTGAAPSTTAPSTTSGSSLGTPTPVQVSKSHSFLKVNAPNLEDFDTFALSSLCHPFLPGTFNQCQSLRLWTLQSLTSLLGWYGEQL